MAISHTKLKKEHSFRPPANDTSKNKQAVQFKDNRPENTTQLKTAQMANSVVQRLENKTGMPDNLKSGIESLSGIDMSDVKVHYNSYQPAQLQAHAFAQGNQIHLGPGQERHLPHEAWHVVQQKQGRVAPTKQLKDKVNINDDSGLEKEADVMGAKAMNTIQQKHNLAQNSHKNSIGQQVYQLAERNPGDLDYGFSGYRHEAMQDAITKGDDKRGEALPTVDHLNEVSGVTEYMKQFKFHELISKIKNYDKTTSKSLTGATLQGVKGRHAILWIEFLKENIDRINLHKQASSAIGQTPTEATKDRLRKNEHQGKAPDKTSFIEWYNNNNIPSDSQERTNLWGWVWNAFFRITSKLGLEFAAKNNWAIHFNISRDSYRRALERRKPGQQHKREAITYSELRHLKKLQDRGKAPKVYFQENTGGVHDVESPFKTLDMLDANGIKRLLQTPQWKTAAINYETRLGVYATKRSDAKAAVQESLKKMDLVLAKKNNSQGPVAFANHRKVFGQQKTSSAGQVGNDSATVRSVVKGIPLPGDDEINMREQVTAIYNASLWNPQGDTMKRILTEIGKITDDTDRKNRAEAIGISETHINEIHELILEQTKTTKEKIIRITDNFDAGGGQQLAEQLLNLDSSKASSLISELDKVRIENGKYHNTNDPSQKKLLVTKIHTMLDKLVYELDRPNILATSVDTDSSRNARVPRGSIDKRNHQKSAKDYEDMGVPLSSREKAAIGGVNDRLAKLPWIEGLAYYSIKEDTGWGKQMKDVGIPTVAGNSGTTARLLAVYKWLGLTKVLPFRLGIMGWMLPSRDHSLYEIMNGAKSVGVTGSGENITNPIKMYHTIDPISKNDLESHIAVNRKFPEGVALEKVSDATYKDLIKQS